MSRAFTVIAVAVALAAAACSGTAPDPPDPPPSTVPVLAGDGNLVTEDELLFLAAKPSSQDIAFLLVGLITGPLDKGGVAHGTDLKICDATDYDGYTDHGYILVEVGVNNPFGDCHYQGDYESGRVYVHLNFGAAVYSDGEAKESNCRKLPGAGTRTTGEYRELTNDTDDPIKRTISHTVEESHSEENSLNETFEESSGTTIEADAAFPGGSVKATEHFDQKFAIEHGSVASDSSTHSETVEDESDVLGGHTVAASFTLDDSATKCDLNINSVLDWTSIDARVYVAHCQRWCSSGQLRTLLDHGVVDDGHNKSFSFGGVEDVLRLAAGHDPHCEGCHFDLPDPAATARDNLGDPRSAGRFVSLAGTRKYTVKDSASVVFRDITGHDQDCVHDVLSTEGTLVSELDDKLEACQS